MNRLDEIKHAIKIAEIADVTVTFTKEEAKYIMDIIEIQKDALFDIHDFCLHCLDTGGEPATAIFHVMNKIMRTSKKIGELDLNEKA